MYRTLPFFVLLGCPADDGHDHDHESDTDTDTDVDTDTDADTDADAPEIAGSYTDGFGGTHDITATDWTMSGIGLFHITIVDNDADYLIAHNDASNDFSADLWSRMDWYDDGAQLWFCQTAYDAASEADAESTPAADSSDPANGGCGGFSWTDLNP